MAQSNPFDKQGNFPPHHVILNSQGRVKTRVVVTLPAGMRIKTVTYADRSLKFIVLGNGCWEWIAGRSTYGYGYCRGRYSTHAHRQVYYEMKGKVPKGLHLDHKCRNPSCINPDHLEPVLSGVNIKRGWDAKKGIFMEITYPQPEQSVSFSVPYLIPVSGNHYKQPRRYVGRYGIPHLGFSVTATAKAYYHAVAVFAAGQTVTPAEASARKKVRYSVVLDVYLGPRQRGDADNFLKCGLDALVQCGVIHSDANVHECRAIVHKNERDNPRTIYTVTRLEN